MKELIEAKYDLVITAIIKITNSTYKLFTDKGTYVIKYHNDNSLEAIYSRLSMLNIEIFLLPIKSVNGNYIENHEHAYFSISQYLMDEVTLNKDIRLHYYIKAIAKLHTSSHYTIKVSDSFFDESLNYLESLCDEAKTSIDTRIERIERLDYKSPSDWYFLMNYDHLLKAIQEARRRINNLEDEWQKAASLHLSLTYQNFDYAHIIVKYNRIISLDKMAIAPSIYDLKSLFDVAYLTKIDVVSLMKEYLALNPLTNYEKEWLLAFLFIPKISRINEELGDISAIFKTLTHLHIVEEFAGYLTSLEVTDDE